MLHTHTGTEQLQTATGAGRLDFGGLELGGLAELLGHHGSKWVDRRGTDHTDVVTRRGHADKTGQ